MGKTLSVKIVGDVSGLKRAFNDAERASSQFGSSIGRGFRDIAKYGAYAAGAAGVGALAITLKAGYSEWSSSQRVMAQTGAVIKSTGGAARVTAGDVDSLASALMRKSGVDDEVIASGENMLLTFTGIRNEAGKGNDVFNQATRTLLDMSVATGKSMPDAAVLLGKALNDPARGISALTRAGVVFTEQQREQIKAMTAAGDTMGAQKIILHELNTEFGGSAEAAGKTLPGQINILRETFSNLSGELVAKLIPVLQGTVSWVNAHWGEISAVMDAVFDGIAFAITRVIGPTFSFLIDRGKEVVAWTRQNWPEISGVVRKVIGDVSSVIHTTIAVIEAVWGRFGTTITRLASNAFNSTKGVVQGVLTAMQGLIDIFVGVLSGDWARAWDGAKAVVTGTIGAMAAALRGAVSNFLILAGALGHAIVDGVKAGLGALFSTVWNAIQSIPSALSLAAGQAYQWALGIGRSIVEGILGGLGDLAASFASKVTGALSDGKNRVAQALHIGSPSRVWRDEIGIPIAEGVIVGWIDGIRDLPSVMTGSLQKAIDRARTQVGNARSRFASVWQDLASDSLAAFDANSQHTLDRLRSKFDLLGAKLDADLSRQLDRIDQGGREATPAERQLQAMDAARAAADRAAAIGDARSALTDATAKGDVDAARSAQKALDDALWNDRRAGLQARADQERAARDQATSEARNAATEAVAVQKSRLDEQYENERIQIQSRLDLQRRHFEAALAATEAHFEKEGSTIAKATAEIVKLLASFDVNFATAGAELGRSFVTGLRESLTESAQGTAGVGTSLDSAIAVVAKAAAKLPLRSGAFTLPSVRSSSAGSGPFNASDTIPDGDIGGGPSDLVKSMWDEYAMARQFFPGGWISNYQPGSRLPGSGMPSDHWPGGGPGPAKAMDVGFSPAIGWANSTARAFFNQMVGRAGIHYVILGDKIWSAERGLHSYSPASDHADHVHVSGYDQGGWLMPGVTLAVNNTGRPEQIIPPGGARAAGGDVHVHLHGTFLGTEPAALVRALLPELRSAIYELQRQNVTSGII